LLSLASFWLMKSMSLFPRFQQYIVGSAISVSNPSSLLIGRLSRAQGTEFVDLN
jgi:hypothetical protein